jgi:hypothetical protein
MLYEAISLLFEEDDGSLPEVQIDGITADEAQAMLDVLLGLADPLRPEQTVWDEERDAPLPIADYPDAGRRAADGRLTALHVVLTGLRSGETDLPDLGVSIWRGTFALDYHGGPDWSPPVLSAFVELLCALLDLSADGQLVLADEVSTALPAKQQEHFREAVRRYRAAAA